MKRVGDAKRDRVYCATALLDILEEPARRSFALDAICQALTTSSGIKVIVATYPLNLFVQTVFTTRASNQPAREVLRDVVDATQRKLEWTLLYDIDDQAYYLNLRGGGKANADITGGKTLELVH